MKGLDNIDHAKWIEMLTAEFPEVLASFDESGNGLLHCEMGAFARLTEKSMDAGNFWQVEKYLRFLEVVRKKASPDVENAIDVSFLGSLAFSEFTENRHRAIKERMPASLRKIVLEMDGRGRWQ